jgi:polyferredoxin/NAD-dependent dihydropyrimidine dehydrogenase PreA subunit
MRIVTARRVSQIFFVLLFFWFCTVSTLGDRFWQLRGWPVNWLLELDPLAGIATLLATRTLYAGLLWGLATVALTLVLGRVFCGWICPFGAMHQFLGYLGRRRKKLSTQLEANRFRPAQAIKYYVLVFFLSAAILLPGGGLSSGSLLTGLLDPLPLIHRSVNLILLPLADRAGMGPSPLPRWYEEAGLIGAVFLAALFLNLWVPRFYCRFVCPLGALLGILSRFAIWRIGRKEEGCTGCGLCERACEGACEPTQRIRISECVMCLNCLDECRHDAIDYGTRPAAASELLLPDLSRRGFIVSAVSGVMAAPVMRLGGVIGPNWNPALIRPPGALSEEAFLARCIKCGQCMRVCPTNVIHPSGLEAGIEGLWTPKLNFRSGTSGCQHTCIACGNLCPTAAIRPISLDERLGRNSFAGRGPIRTGMAFVDRGRCLPWSMDRPCIVCQENCPVSPKAIFTREVFNAVRTIAPLTLKNTDRGRLALTADALVAGHFGTGDYYALLPGGLRLRITANTTGSLELERPLTTPEILAPGSAVSIQVRLQQPYVDPKQCIGCGVCEHECPVLGLRAIRVTAENESRLQHHRMVL